MKALPLCAAYPLLLTVLICSCATPPLPLNGCISGEAIICEDFEQATDISRWSNRSTMSLSSQQVFSGAHSLQIRAPGGEYNHNYLVYDIAETALQRAQYGRMMIWLDETNSRSGDFSFVQVDGDATVASGAPKGTRVVSRGRLDGRFDHFFANYDTLGDKNNDGEADWLTDCWKHPPFSDTSPPPDAYLIPANRWACVQWHYDAAHNEMQFWLDNKSLDAIHVTGTGDGCLGHKQRDYWIAPQSYDTLKVGVEQYHRDTQARTLYIDNLEVGSEPIACPAP
ncbi:hypothetical protein P886_4045 [Alteromonadaceae bacterium 2753L.S.0a.02]|nr:hypothetical protein P886_4045 [Alteromonadaceae bacterium 2753L.S.0a.02]